MNHSSPMLSVPSEADWRSEPWCLDAENAYGNFQGKTHAEAIQLFRDHSIGRQEDVMFMPLACFPFYFNVYMDYLLSPEAKDDSSGASCFFTLVNCRRFEIKRLDDWIIEKTIHTIASLSENQLFYDAEPELYGSFRERGAKSLKYLE